MGRKTAFFTGPGGRVELEHHQIDQLPKSQLDEADLVMERKDIPEPPDPDDGYKIVTYIENGQIVYKQKKMQTQ